VTGRRMIEQVLSASKKKGPPAWLNPGNTGAK
jgi:hypothetical protein